MVVTLTAFGPLGPFSASKLTFAPSGRERKPFELIPVWWTKRSFPPSSGVMKPKPFSSLNHFTVPVAIVLILHEVMCAANAEELVKQLAGAGTTDGRGSRPLHPEVYPVYGLR